MQIQHSTYHRVLRVSAVICAFILLFQTGLVFKPTQQLSQHTQNYLANAIGMSASVEPTELNSLTAELTAQKLALSARESAVAEREIAVNLAQGGPDQRATYVMAAILFILLLLIILNYVLDYLRSRNRLTSNELQTV
jgi:hypothetical protein